MPVYLCVFEDDGFRQFYPLTRTRPVFDLRIGAETLLESIARTIDASQLLLQTRPELAEVAAANLDVLTNHIPNGLDVLFVNGRLLVDANPSVVSRIIDLADGEAQAIRFNSEIVAAWYPSAPGCNVWDPDSFDDLPSTTIESNCLVNSIWQLLDVLGANIESVFDTLSKGYNIFERPEVSIADSAVLLNSERILTKPTSRIEAGVILDATNGPIILDAGSVVSHGAVVHGPVYVGENCIIKIGANIRQSAFGPVCKVAGEVHTSIMHSHSNKAHDGFLGHSLLGEWCNLGAATNNSNLKNDYGKVALYSESEGEFVSTGRQFMGLVMGDHSKCGISTMFNTGTCIGVSCNLFGAGYQPRFVPSFMWGGPDTGFAEYRLPRAIDVARIVMDRRNVTQTDADLELLTSVFESTAEQRSKGPLR